MNTKDEFVEMCERGKNYPKVGHHLARWFDMLASDWKSGDLKDVIDGSVISCVSRCIDEPSFKPYVDLVRNIEAMYQNRYLAIQKELRKQNQKVS